MAFRFAVAFSLPGEKVELIRPIAEEVRERLPGREVFFHAWPEYEAELVRMDADVWLQDRVFGAARLVVPVFSAEYQHKPWCGVVEWRAIRALLMKRGDAVMPLKVGDAEIPGLFPQDLPLDPTHRAAADVAELIVTRLSLIETPDSARGPERLGADPPPERWKALASSLLSNLQRVDNEDDWSDMLYSVLGAEIEVDLGSVGRRQLRRVPSLNDALAAARDRLVLVEGEPGSGKSVALRHLASTSLSQAIESTESHPVLPIYVNLRELLVPEGGIVDALAVRAFLLRQLSGAEDAQRRFAEAYFEWALDRGRWLFLLDSFDEIPELLGSTEPDETVRRYAEAIHAFANGLHESRVVVSSRPYRGPGRMPWPRYRILPLSDAGRRNTVTSWFGGGALTDRVLGELVSAKNLSAWVTSPMLLGLICAHRKAEGALPESAHDAFESFVVRRIECRPDLVQRRGLSTRRLRDGAEEIAFAITSDIHSGMIVTREWLHEFRWSDGLAEDLDAVLECLIELKLARGATRSDTISAAFSFRHRRIQEYFATCHVMRGRAAVPPRAFLVDERWRETAVTLLVAGSDSSVRAMLEPAAEMLERHVEELRTRLGAEVLTVIPTDAEGFDLLRREVTPGPFPWPTGVLHLLGVIARLRSRGTLDESEPTLERVRCAADEILTQAVARGLRLDQSWALDVSGAASTSARAALLSWAFETGSAWLEDVAFTQASASRELPPILDGGIRRALVWHDLTGELHRESMRFEVQVRRVDGSGPLLDALRLLRAGPRVEAHAVAYAFVLSLGMAWAGRGSTHGASATEVTKLLSSILVLPTLALVLPRMVRWFSRETHRARGTWRTVRTPRLLRPFVPPRQERSIFGWLAGVAATSLGMLPALFAAILVELEAGPFWATIAAVPLALGLSFRSGAQFAVREGSFRSRITWPCVALSALVATLSTFRTRAAWLGAIPVASTFLVAAAATRWLESASEPVRRTALLVNLVAFVGAVGAATFAGLHDLVHGWRTRRSCDVDVDTLLEDAARFKSADSRARYLRWVRECGRLQSSRHALRVLRQLLAAVERDAAAVVHRRGRTQPFRCDPGWRDLGDWYDRHAHRRFGLAGWNGGSLDELSRLYEQAQLRSRVDDGVRPYDDAKSDGARGTTSSNAGS